MTATRSAFATRSCQFHDTADSRNSESGAFAIAARRKKRSSPAARPRLESLNDRVSTSPIYDSGRRPGTRETLDPQVKYRSMPIPYRSSIS